MAGLCVRGLRCADVCRRSTGERIQVRRDPVRQSVGSKAAGGATRGAACERLEPRALLAAAPAPAGAEFRVNSITTGSQELFAEAPHAVASDADGDFVVTWSSSGQDGSAWGVYAQRYGADGVKRGAELRVNQVTANSQWYPNVACDAVGNFVVVWTSSLQDGSGDGVYARRYSAAGVPLGNEFRVNSTVADNQRHPNVAMSADGAFVITWSGFGQAGGASWDVYARRYDAFGAARGSEFRVNSTTAGDQQFASVAADNAGNLIVTWTTDAQDGNGTAVYAQRYAAAGTVRGGEFRVNTATTGNQQYSRVAADADGDFVIAWASAGQDGSGRGVYAQRYAAAGTTRGAEFRVNEITAGEQFAPTVASDAAGGFVVTWTGQQDGDLFGVFARAYDAGGASRGGEFRVNTYRAGNQVYSAAASSADGKLAVVWQSDGQDGSFFGVYGQRYAAPDLNSPTANIIDITPDPRDSSVDTATIVFNEPVVDVDVVDFTLTRNGGPDLLTVSQSVASIDGGRTWTLSGLLSLTAAAGEYVLSLKLSGTGIKDLAGNALAGGASDTWTVLPPPARVVGRYVFYNGSSYDGHDSGAGPSDDDAIASDKQALLPGSGRARFSNYTSYPRGINGIMVDVANLGAGVAAGPGEPASLSILDFAFRTGNVPDAALWTAASHPDSITVRHGAGAGGSDRVTLVWADDAVVRGWLQLTILATAATRLAAPDVFYFGNLPGETGDSTDVASVDGIDFFRTRAAAHGESSNDVSSPFDHDRDGDVDVRDLIAVRSALGSDPLTLIGNSAIPGAPSSPSTRRSYRPDVMEVLSGDATRDRLILPGHDPAGRL